MYLTLCSEIYCYRQVKYHPSCTCASGTSVVYKPVVVLQPFLVEGGKKEYL